MGLSRTASRAASPQRAASYYRGSRRGNELPAILWLVLLLVVVNVVRTGGRPSASQALTWCLLAGGIVLLGAVAPTEVIGFLAVLLVAAVLNIAGPLTGVLASLESRVGGLISKES